MAKALYGEVHRARARVRAALRAADRLRLQIAVSALPLKGAPVCSKFFVRDMLGRGDVTLRYTTSARVCLPLDVPSGCDVCCRWGDCVSSEACCACGQRHD